MRQFITSLDVEFFASRGLSVIELDPDTIVTDAARETAQRLGLRFSCSGAEEHGVPQGAGSGLLSRNRVMSEKAGSFGLSKDVAACRRSSASANVPEEMSSSTSNKNATLEELARRVSRLEAALLHVTGGTKRVDQMEVGLVRPGSGLSNESLVEEDIAGLIAAGGASSSHEPAAAPTSVADLVVTGGEIVLPGLGVIRANLIVKNGKILGLSNEPGIRARRTIDASGLLIMPGVVDPHVHLGLFNPLEVELVTETMSAALGGVTTIGWFLSGKGSYLKFLDSVQSKIEALSVVDIFIHVAITDELQVKEIPRYVNEFGVTSFKVYMAGVDGLISPCDDAFMLKVLSTVAETSAATGKRCVVCVHAENNSLVTEFTSAMINGDTLEEWAQARPGFGEAEAIRRAATWARKAMCPVYFVHVSSQEGLEAAREVKQQIPYAYAETTSAYLAVTSDSSAGILAKTVPPFRDKAALDSLWKGVQEGVIDSIGTDSVAISKDLKTASGFWNAPPGFAALGTHLAVLLSEGVNRRKIPIADLAKLLCLRPAEIFGLFPAKGALLPGSDADVAIVDLSRERVVDYRDLGSCSDFSIYDGLKFQGWPVITIKSGKVVAQDGKFVGSQGGGRYLGR